MILEQLKTEFGDCKFQEVKPCSGSYDECLNNEFFIFDPPNGSNEPVKIVAFDEEFQLKIINNTISKVNLVKTDKCLFTNEVSKCDCILFNERKLYFVEIKSSGNKSVRRRDAVAQLGATIERLLDNGIKFDNLDAKAIICFKRDKEYPTLPSSNSKRAIFQERYSVSLEEGNKIEF